MKFIKSKKGAALLAVLAIAVISAVGAYAYFTSSGAGTGAATVAGSNGTTLAITGDSADTTGLYPGGSLAVDGNVHNGGAQSVGLVGPIKGVVSLAAGASADAVANCDPAWFSVDDVTVPASTFIAAGGDRPFSTTLHMSNPAVSQDSCKSAPLTITWSS